MKKILLLLILCLSLTLPGNSQNTTGGLCLDSVKIKQLVITTRELTDCQDEIDGLNSMISADDTLINTYTKALISVDAQNNNCKSELQSKIIENNNLQVMVKKLKGAKTLWEVIAFSSMVLFTAITIIYK